jgi:hypothetical protein
MRSSSLHLVVVVVDARGIHISEGWITTGGGRLADGIAETTGVGRRTDGYAGTANI